MAKFKTSPASKKTATPRKRAAAKKAATATSAAKKKTTAPVDAVTGGASSIMESAQHIWESSIQALGRAQQEGTRLFETLVKEGSHVEKKTRSMASDKVSSVRGSVENRVDQVKGRATDTWDRLEKVFEERVQRALVRLGVPGRDELQALIDRVDELNAHLRELGGDAAASAPKTPTKKTGTTVAKKTGAQKSVTKATVKKTATTKKTASKKTASRKTSTAKTADTATAKPAAKKASAKKATVKKTAAKKTTTAKKAAGAKTARKPAVKKVVLATNDVVASVGTRVGPPATDTAGTPATGDSKTDK